MTLSGITLGWILTALLTLQKGLGTIMADLAALQATVAALQAASAAREARDTQQDAVTAAQIVQLQANVDALNAVIASGVLSPADQATVDAIMVSITGVIDSLNSADPTAPVVA